MKVSWNSIGVDSVQVWCLCSELSDLQHVVNNGAEGDKVYPVGTDIFSDWFKQDGHINYKYSLYGEEDVGK
jgi:hypothetical protein